MALRAQNYTEDEEVHMIEFESTTVMNQHKLKKLDSLNMHSRGGTSMAGVVSKLEALLIKFSDKTINIWVISDGQISDQRAFKESMTKRLAGHFNSPNVNVVGVRLCSGWSDPDITAMSAVGLLSTQQFKVEDFKMDEDDYYNSRQRRENHSPDNSSLVEILTGMRAPEEKFELRLDEPRIIKRPGEDGQEVLDLWNGDWFIIKDGDPNKPIFVKDVPIQIELYPETENLSLLEQFATKIYLRLAQEKVAELGIDNVKYIEALEQLFDDLENMSRVVEMVHKENHSEMSTTSRALQIRQKFGKQQKTLRQKISELKNLRNMDTMTGHMKSNLLRNLGTGKGDMGLMRRFYRTDQGKDPASMMSDAIDKCKKALPDLKTEVETSTREECFFSKESSLDAAIAAIETSADLFEESDEVSPDSLLTVFGLHGLAINHKAGNYTDPMLIGLNQGVRDTIHEVFTNVCLNQSVLWFAKQNGTEITAPGFNKPITAVVPIKDWNHPAVWKLFCHDSDIGAMQMSAHLRNTLTPLPKDRVAFSASLLLKMMSDWTNPTEIQRKMMAEVLTSIQWKNQNDKAKAIAEGLRGENPLAILSTENNLASELAPFAQVLCDSTLLAFLAEPESKNLWKALLANTLYWSVRRSIGDADRSDIIKKLLSIDSEKFTHPLPDDQEEPTSVSIHDMWDEQKAEEYMNKHKYLYVQKLFKNLLGLANAFKGAGCKTSPDIFNQDPSGKAKIGSHILGMEFNLFCLVEVVKSIETRSEVDRYGEGSIGFLLNAEEATNFLKGLVRDLYRQRYDTELKQKLERVKEKNLKTFLQDSKTYQFDKFATDLQKNIPNQNSKGITDLLDSMTKDPEGTTDLSQKAELLLLGVFKDHTWNNGSVARNGCSQLLRLLEPLLSAERYAEIKEHVDKYSWHRYRDTPENRQGHCNEKPSFWAATNYVDPWSFLKNDQKGYRQWLKTLATLDGGDHSHQVIFNEWKHLLEVDPHKHDVNAGKALQTR